MRSRAWVPSEMSNGEQAEKQTSRLEAFSDGVFAIAITLLVLELKVPVFPSGGVRPTSAALAAGLMRQWPSYLALVTSFFSVLVMWVHHHALFRCVRQTDARLLFANGFLLLVVSIVPFPTAVLANYFDTPAAPAACAVYAGVFVLIGIAFYLLLLAAFRHEIVGGAPSETRLARLRRSYRLGPPLYLLATVAAPFNRWVTMGICTALWILWAATTREC